MRSLLMRGVLLAGLAACSGCAHGGVASAATPAATPTPTGVRVVAVQRRKVSPALTIPGTIAPNAVIALSNALSEPTLAVYVREGDRVRAGQLIAQLNVDDLEANLRSAIATTRADEAKTSQTSYSAQLAYQQGPAQTHQAQAALEQARQTLAEARKNLQRDEMLVGEGYIPSQNLDEQRIVVRNDEQAELSAGAQLRSAVANEQANGSTNGGLQQATIEQAQASAQAQDATADQLRKEIERASITSPVDGVVINRNLNPGEYPSGRQIFTIEANTTLYAVLTASAVQAYEVQPGDAVEMTLPGIPRVHFQGRVETILDAGTPGSTNFTVKVAIPNPRGSLRAGTPVQAMIDLQPTTGPAIPTSAFVDDSHTTVAVVSNGKAHVLHVSEVATDGTTSVVTGLNPGTRIVRDGGSQLTSGEAVQAVH